MARHDLVTPVGNFLEIVSRPFNPWVVWKMDAVKFPVNSVEVYFLAMLFGVIAYCVVSWMTLKAPFNLDRMLHRGIYADPNDHVPAKQHFSFRWLIQRIVGIDHQYSTGDKVIAWSVVCWSLVWHFGVLFLGVLAWNAFSPWSSHAWAVYFFITTIVTAILVGSVSTVWFVVGGVKDSFALFRDLKARIANPDDNGRVEGHVSTVDLARFEQIEKEALAKEPPSPATEVLPENTLP